MIWEQDQLVIESSMAYTHNIGEIKENIVDLQGKQIIMNQVVRLKNSKAGLIVEDNRIKRVIGEPTVEEKTILEKIIGDSAVDRLKGYRPRHFSV